VIIVILICEIRAYVWMQCLGIWIWR